MPVKTWEFEDKQFINQLVVDTDAATVVLSWAYKPGVHIPQFEAPAGRCNWTLETFVEQASPYHSQPAPSLAKQVVSADVRRAVVDYINRIMKRA